MNSYKASCSLSPTLGYWRGRPKNLSGEALAHMHCEVEDWSLSYTFAFLLYKIPHPISSGMA
jgi:hypothetical protein